ncbi:homoserine O-acetyltransferase [Nesterenkonia sp. NBAIMH1]|uniref:homoserine O-acetyltransferase MetX n=1 Tax=Nesterenkonia sp. NBAIMH1 TaxID=2600320 RepID=UPI0011B42020
MANDYGHHRPGALSAAEVGAYDFETGGHLPEVTLAYETWGTLNAAGDNAVLVAHALTGDSHVASTRQDPEAGWWQSLVGPGRPIDTRTWFVVAPAMVGGCYGSTGPGSPDSTGVPWGSRFPFVTIRDSVHLERRLLEQLGVSRLHAVIGGSMGGARALEWAATCPDLVDGVGVFACGAASTAEQIAFGQTQVLAIRNDRHFHGGDYYAGPRPEAGLQLARRIAHITYRTGADLHERFGRTRQGAEDPFGSPRSLSRAGRYQVESYMDYHGRKLSDRFDPNAYLTLAEALISHDVGRGRGGARAALAGVRARAFVVAVDSDRLYYPSESHELADMLPGADGAHVISSPIGHDGFLTSPEQLGAELREALAL